MGRGDLTAHGFRSTFRDWAGETTAHPREVIEAALAHRLKDKAEAAYARGDLFVKRRKLMEDWAAFLAKPAGEVLTMPAYRAPRRLRERSAMFPAEVLSIAARINSDVQKDVGHCCVTQVTVIWATPCGSPEGKGSQERGAGPAPMRSARGLSPSSEATG